MINIDDFPKLNENSMINGINYDDISYICSLFYAVSMNSGLSFKSLSSRINPDFIKHQLDLAYLTHTQVFPESIDEISSLLNITLNDKYITYGSAYGATTAIRKMVALSSHFTKLKPQETLYILMNSGKADEIILYEDNSTMIPNTVILLNECLEDVFNYPTQ